jgi:uncharacterized membrane protein AbrB (regulator of aidB expression)
MLYAAALVSGYLMSLLRVPLPWMIGPMVLAATVSLAGKTPTIPRITRPIGRWWWPLLSASSSRRPHWPSSASRSC